MKICKKTKKSKNGNFQKIHQIYIALQYTQKPVGAHRKRTKTCGCPQKTHKTLWVRTENTQKPVGAHMKIPRFSKNYQNFRKFRKNLKILKIPENFKKILRKSRVEIMICPDIFSSATKKVMSGCYFDVVSRVLSE